LRSKDLPHEVRLACVSRLALILLAAEGRLASTDVFGALRPQVQRAVDVCLT